MKDHAAEATVAAVAKNMAIGGGGAAFWGGLTANHVAAIGGLIVGVIGLAVQVYYKRRADQRHEEIHRLRVQARLLKPYEDDADE